MLQPRNFADMCPLLGAQRASIGTGSALASLLKLRLLQNAPPRLTLQTQPTMVVLTPLPSRPRLQRRPMLIIL